MLLPNLHGKNIKITKIPISGILRNSKRYLKWDLKPDTKQENSTIFWGYVLMGNIKDELMAHRFKVLFSRTFCIILMLFYPIFVLYLILGTVEYRESIYTANEIIRYFWEK